MQLQCHGSAKKHKKAKNEHKTPQEFPAKEPDKKLHIMVVTGMSHPFFMAVWPMKLTFHDCAITS